MNRLYFLYISHNPVVYDSHIFRLISTLYPELFEDRLYSLMEFVDEDSVTSQFNENFLQGFKSFGNLYISTTCTSIIKYDFIENIKKSIPVGSTIVVSCTSYIAFRYLVDLIKSGYKLVIGGQLINSSYCSVDDIRKCFLKIIYNLDLNRRLLDNVMFIKGYLRPEIDLKEIIERWEDIDIGIPNDFTYFKNCIIDNKKYEKNFSKLKFLNNEIEFNETIPIFMNIGCKWSKCKFCACSNNETYPSYSSIFNNVDEFDEHIFKLIDLYNIQERLAIRDNQVTENTLDIILSSKSLYNIKSLYMFCNTVDLLKENFVKKILKLSERCYVFLFTGLDSCLDYSLEKTNRPYRFKQIVKAADIYRLFLRRNINVHLSWIPDLPVRNVKDIVTNYTRLWELIKYIYGYDDNFIIDKNCWYGIFSNHSLEHYPCINIPGIVPIYENYFNENVSGLIHEAKYILSYDYLQNEFFPVNGHYVLPFIRVGENNKIIRSDFTYLDRLDFYNLFGKISS